jgi:acetate kinase
MKVLILNCGSSSIKYQLVETSLELIASNADRAIARGGVERIGTSGARHPYLVAGRPKRSEIVEILEHGVAIAEILKKLIDPEAGVVQGPGDIEAVGHRVVHGGERFRDSALATPEVAHAVEEFSDLAPLHNPHNLRGYQAAQHVLPAVPHVLVFDTAFHQTLPAHAYLYGLPHVLYSRHAIRRYGFHGISHRYVSWRSQAVLGRPREETRLDGSRIRTLGILTDEELLIARDTLRLVTGALHPSSR